MKQLPNNFTNLGLGTSHLASLGRAITTSDAKKLFEASLEKNVRVIDTSNTYGSGDSERLIGKSIKGVRDEFFIMTKAGFPHVHLPSSLSPLNQIGKKFLQKMNKQKCYSSDYLVTSIQKSLKRLGTDSIDCFLLHEPLGHELIKFEDFWKGLEIIKEKGLAKYVGISTNDFDAFKLATDRTEIDFVQTAMPYNKKDDKTVFYHSNKKGIPVILNQVLSPYKNLIERDDIKKVLLDHNMKSTDLMSILLKYVIEHEKGNCALIGTRNPKHLIQNVEGFDQKSDLNEFYKLLTKIIGS